MENLICHPLSTRHEFCICSESRLSLRTGWVCFKWEVHIGTVWDGVNDLGSFINFRKFSCLSIQVSSLFFFHLGGFLGQGGRIFSFSDFVNFTGIFFFFCNRAFSCLLAVFDSCRLEAASLTYLKKIASFISPNT